MLLPAIIDIEASGFGAGSYPIEIGWIEQSGKAHCHLIRPFEHWTHWDKSAERLHGISRVTLSSAGKAPEFVAEALNASLVGKTVYSDAWSHDMCWLGCLFDAAGIVQRFRIESLLTMLSEQEKDSWSAVLEEVRKKEKLTRHRASSDARVIQKCFGAIVENRARPNQLTG